MSGPEASRAHHNDAPEHAYIFTDSKVPPAYVVITDEGNGNLIPDGPFSDGQLDIFFKYSVFTEQRIG